MQVPSGIAIGLIGGCIAIGAVWVLAERLLEILPGMMHCNVCGSRLGRRDFLRNLRASPKRTYPFRMMDGTREEQPIRSLCTKCDRRAQRLRREAPMAPDAPEATEVLASA
jgi:hypothetical protein